MKKGVQILVYYGEHSDKYWLVDTPQRLEAAQRKLFKQLDEQGYYNDDEKHISEARAGDIYAIRWLLVAHRRREYEDWDVEEALDPCIN